MSSQPYSEHEKYADAADDYLDQHNIYELLSGLMRKLVVHKPKDPLAFCISALQQPVQQIRVLVVSPPSETTRNLISSLVRELGVLRLKLSSIISEEIATGSPLGKQAATYLESDQPLPDQLAIPLIAARTNKADALATGWILEGYPTTRVQALALQAGGILPTHVLYFKNAPTSSSASNVNAENNDTIDGHHFSDPDAAALDLYKRHGASVQEVFAHCAHFFDLQKSEQTLHAEIADLLNAPPKSQAPKRPMRVFLLGPRGSGRHTQASLLAQKYGLVHVNATELLRNEIKRTPNLKEKVSQYLNNGLLVPDEIIAPLVVSRVLAADAKARGYVLEGFPRTKAQADLLEKHAVHPSRVVLLDVSEDEIRDRILGRRKDPDTGDEYVLRTAADEAALPGAVRDRIIHARNDQQHTLEAINFSYNSFIDDVKTKYQRVSRVIAAGGRKSGNVAEVQQAKQAVLEQVEDFILSPLTNLYAHAAAKKAPSGEAPAKQ